MLINVASRCGYTSQYTDLQSLYDKQSDKIEVWYPCNDFGRQGLGLQMKLKILLNKLWCHLYYSRKVKNKSITSEIYGGFQVLN